ncbi:MAG: CusA/CzcA family heavy metal efflux RND transporter [Phycisphaerales bacterium]|nr:CusA/CzcA family heavy metal efflux RND transporter [Phycisphaerales bacterium]
MLKSIVRFSINNKLIIIALTIALIFAGIRAVQQLEIDALPDITNNQVQVISVVPNLSSEEVERIITLPIEYETKNIPGLTEQRSLSRFGLSIVTIVFNDKTDVYWARQQVSERLVNLREQIPPSIAVPYMGPVTTGLGEIYQYVVRATKGYETRYSLSDLREIQDWIVRRQLLGTPGVADVATLGGNLRQYEVAVKLDKLNSFGVSVNDLAEVLMANNSNAGGAYIEKGPYAVFIRTEGRIKSLDDIANIVVKKNTTSGIPVLIKDVAEVHYGRAIRYGAMLQSNYGEVCGAVVMMVKGANTNQVITNIKTRIAEIQKTLPEGVVIDPFLDRSKMIGQAIHTVTKNLIEGAIIVLFILICFLSSFRAGFIVASVIPLSMLFTIIMMDIFGISGNLMSLGALDFGLLVDGAVIIVEVIIHNLQQKNLANTLGRAYLTQKEFDREVEQSSIRMMRSAMFGQLIILIVYIPIITLTGIEGKMFRPMALTIIFALMGASVLSITYIPVMVSILFSKKIDTHEVSYAQRLMNFINAKYQWLLSHALQKAILVILIPFLLFIGSVILLTQLGGEFIPVLPEGDFAVETHLLPGSSLTQTITSLQKASDLLSHRFPEVLKVVAKIGASEIPTDPQTINGADLIVSLQNKNRWTTAKDYPELADSIKSVLSDIPNISTGVQYPVQMRFNELMTGSTQDVVCKIFGDDFDYLSDYANKISNIIGTIKGAKDIYIEPIVSVPQLVVRVNRQQLAIHNAQVDDVNALISTLFAGNIVGKIYEKEKYYDLVIRMNAPSKENLESVKNMLLLLKNGEYVRLGGIARVSLEANPFEIRHEDSRRRVVVGFNVRNRDVASIVNELQTKIAQHIKLRPGYYIAFGGEYKNMNIAINRLQLILPIALLLIFFILYLSFKNFKYCVIIFVTIPLSCIGGVLALWLRHFPFSISAGVGFIALFGVVVLNGIVLINEFKNIRENEAALSLKDQIKLALTNRLRPILMTALVASFGFLPMVFSQSEGSEVQRPLATVVIGGLLVATCLTLFVLPCIYYLVEKRASQPKSMKPNNSTNHVTLMVLVLLSGLLLHSNEATAQVNVRDTTPIKQTDSSWYIRSMTIEELLALVPNSPSIAVSNVQVEYQKILKRTGDIFPNTTLSVVGGNINSPLYEVGFDVAQTFVAPTTYKKQRNVLETIFKGAQIQQQLTMRQVKEIVTDLYVQLQYLEIQRKILLNLDTVFEKFKNLSAIRYEKGDVGIIEKVSFDNRYAQNKLNVKMVQHDIYTTQVQIATLLRSNFFIAPAQPLTTDFIFFDSALIYGHPYLKLYQQQIEQAKANTILQKVSLFPTFSIDYHNQSFKGYFTYPDNTTVYLKGTKRYSSITGGVNVPIFNKAANNKIKAAKANERVSQALFEEAKTNFISDFKKTWQDYQKLDETTNYFEQSALPQANKIIEIANIQYEKGAINYIEWGNAIKDAIDIRNNYWSQVFQKKIVEYKLMYLLDNN